MDKVLEQVVEKWKDQLDKVETMISIVDDFVDEESEKCALCRETDDRSMGCAGCRGHTLCATVHAAVCDLSDLVYDSLRGLRNRIVELIEGVENL